MVSVSLRTHSKVPLCSILLWQCPVACAPTGYTVDSWGSCRFIKNVVNACTNPGTTGGATTHSHGGVTHSHTSLSAGAHTHVLVSTGPSGNTVVKSAAADWMFPTGHTHCKTSNSTNAAPTTATAGCHTHPGGNDIPPYRTYAFIRRSGSLSLRKSAVPWNAYVLWQSPLACIPSWFGKNSSLINSHIRGVVNSCTNPGNTGGCSNHTHISCGAHTHNASVGSHTHTYTANWSAVSSVVGTNSRVGSTMAKSTHSHTFTFPTSCAATGSGTTNNAGGHTHNTVAICPISVTVVPIKPSSISMRRQGIPRKGIVYWKNTLATIPSAFGLQNGANCTFNTLDKFHREYATACTNPNVIAGSNCHTHTSDGAHTHTATITHNHPQSGGASAGPCLCNVNCGFFCTGSIEASKTHTHTPSAYTNCSNICASYCSAGGHTHAAANHRPPYIEVAFIQRL